MLFSSYAFSQGYDFQQLCLDCAAQNGFYCGDDPANWTQYSPNGCVPNGEGGLMYLNDGWDDCVNGADEDDAVPTSPDECAPPAEECDTVYVEIPVIEYEYIYETDTIIEYETVIQTEYVYVTDTVYADVLDTMYIDVIEYVEVIVIDTVVETEYVEIVVVDTVVEYVEVINTEYVDCDTGMPCNSGMEEILDKSINTGLIYDINGREMIETKLGQIYIKNNKKYIRIK